MTSFKHAAYNLLISVLALLTALLVGSLVIILVGSDPIASYSALFRGAFGSVIAFSNTITISVPLIFTGLAVAVAFKCRAFNIGAEGQLIVGGFIAGILGIYLEGLPNYLHIPIVLIGSILGGALWALVPGLLKMKRNVHIVISTIMFNYIATYIVQYLVLGPFKAPGTLTATRRIARSAVLPRLLPPPNSLNLGIIIAVASVILIYILLEKTKIGYEIKAVGLNQEAAGYNGINVARNTFLVLLVSGGLAGLAGGIEITGSLFRVYDGFSPGYGFTGIPVALLARNNPFAILISALLFGAMRNGAVLMQASQGVSQHLVSIIQGIIISFIAAENLLKWFIEKRMGGSLNG